MPQTPVSNVLRGAGWCLALLLLASLGGVSRSAAEPQPVASSVYAGPVAVLHQVHQRDSVPVPPSTPAPTPPASPTPAPTPAPTPVPSPVAVLPPQPASEAESPPAPQPALAPTPAPTPPPPPPQRYTDAEAAAAIVTLTNDLRAQQGLPPLTINDALTAAARDYAQTMAANDWFAHDGPDGSTLSSRAEAAGYTGWTYLAENLYGGFYGEPSANIIQMWADSPGHRAAMLSDVATEIGVGCHVSGDYRWCVQDFGAR